MEMCFNVIEELRNSNLYKINGWRHLNLLKVLLYFAIQYIDIRFAEGK